MKAGDKETQTDRGTEVRPWEADLDALVFVTWETCDGSDGGLSDLRALRIEAGDGAPKTESLHIDGQRVQADPQAAWRELLAFCGPVLTVVPLAKAFHEWDRQYTLQDAPPVRAVGLAEVAALLLPGRAGSRANKMLDATPDASIENPDSLRAALSRLVRQFLSADPDVVHTVCVGFATAWARLSVTEPLGAEHLGRVLQLLAGVLLWLEQDDQQSPVTPLHFESDPLEADFLHVVLDGSLPRWTKLRKEWQEHEPLPPNREAALPWTPEDEALLDLAFREHLPAMFEERHAAGKVYRESQHAVSREVAKNLGRSVEAETQLLLVHAPTGTGKTLAYLVPALLWSKRHGIRVGIATYTRALQEQAIDREVPLALEALRRSGLAPGLRISMLKGRENYVCWRTLKLHIPPFEASGEQWLAFCQLLAFSLFDEAGDLDRLPRRSPLELGHNTTYRATLSDLIRQVRARTSCCRAKEDKHTCGAEVARWRAERSHLVVTNHSFALARQEFFRHMIFDECEHLHEQAHSAWSHSVGLSSISQCLERLYNPSQARARGLFVRVSKRIVEGTPSSESLHQCRAAHGSLLSAFQSLKAEAKAFEVWRRAQVPKRDEREDHSLLREFAESPGGNELILQRLSFCQAANQLDEKLAELSTRLESLGANRMARLRRALDLARADLDEYVAGVTAWLPLQEGKPTFNARTFNDVETDAHGGLTLSARVLLPNEYLGRFYYPQLASASFLSATTYMQGGFDAASSYLGLDRATLKDEDNPELLCKLHTFRSPEVFDYSRVLICIPRDAPSVARDKEAFLRYTRDFLAELGERTNGRILALFTNSDDVRRVGVRLEGHFRARKIGFWYQNMPGSTKEELGELFRTRVDSVLLGVDTFWYGADFPGQTLEHLVLVRMPYGVPDRYHHAQCAALGINEQRRQIYMPRALAKFRQGFGRLMRRTSDRGCVHILDHRVVDPRHRGFLRELPAARIGEETESLARLVRGDTQRCMTQAMIHMGLESQAPALPVQAGPATPIERFEPVHETAPDEADATSLSTDDLPF